LIEENKIPEKDSNTDEILEEVPNDIEYSLEEFIEEISDSTGLDLKTVDVVLNTFIEIQLKKLNLK